MISTVFTKKQHFMRKNTLIVGVTVLRGDFFPVLDLLRMGIRVVRREAYRRCRIPSKSLIFKTCNTGIIAR